MLFGYSVRWAPTGASVRVLAASVALGLVAGCGGGGGGTPPSPPPPAPVNQAPVFTSANSVAVAENVSGGIYQAVATDPEANPVAYSVVGGADAARFAITTGGQLSFVASPNFDLPADSDGNNVYQVELAASDGTARGTLTVSVTVSNSKEGIAVRRVGTGFTNPSAVSAISDTFLLVAEKSGAIYGFNSQTGLRQLLVQVPNVGGVGVVAALAGSDYFLTGRFFVMYHNAGGFLVVQEYLRNPAGTTGPNNFGPLLAVDAPQYAGGGWLGYDPAGNLLIATGDAGGAGDPSGSAQNDASRLGKIIRATRNPDPFAGGSPVFYFLSVAAKGLHQPVGGFTFNGGLLIGDRGESVAEEVDLLPAGSGTTNFGWPFKEGTKVVRGTPPAGVVDPVIEYSRTAAAVQGIVGGAILRTGLSSTVGHYVFADRSGGIFSIPATELANGRTATAATFERRTLDFTPDAGQIGEPVAVVGDEAGRVYIIDSDGEIFRVDQG